MTSSILSIYIGGIVHLRKTHAFISTQLPI
uniref:Uncharacterized protein n=1 Tax=Arundo donax TaxID=35708 RepID=A0A0A9GK64_ARUDO